VSAIAGKWLKSWYEIYLSVLAFVLAWEVGTGFVRAVKLLAVQFLSNGAWSKRARGPANLCSFGFLAFHERRIN
jgi:hypothetical protein